MRKIRRRFNHKIYYTMLKGYVLFSLITVIALIIGLIVLAIGFTTNVDTGNVPKLLPSQLIQPDYLRIDASDLTKIGGYVEIIDTEGNIIHIVGHQTIEKTRYESNEIIAMLNAINIGYHSSFLVGYSESSDTSFYTTGEYFIGNDGNEYLCITKIPKDVMNIQISLSNNFYNEYPSFYNPFIMGITVFIALFVINLLLFTFWLMKKIKKPLDTIHEGIDELSVGNLDIKMDVKGEAEFVKIGNAFNTMTTQLKENLSERERLEQTRQDMLVHISHDIKTPITSIQGYSKILMGDITTSKEEQKEYIERIFNKTEKLTQIVDTLCEYVKLDHEIEKPNLKPQDIVETIRGIVAFCYSDMEDKGISMELKLPNHEIVLAHDKNQIERAIMNIMINAIKYNPSGTMIKIKLFQKNNSVITEIIDNGVGISDEQINTIFDPFIRGDQARGSEGGTGLGLAIAKKIIERHDGKLDLIVNRSETEKTIFRITLQ